MSSNRNPFEEYNSVPPSLQNNPFAEFHPENPSALNTAGDYAEKFNKSVQASRLPALAGGLLQGTGDIGASLANIPLSLASLMSGKNLNIPHPNLGQYLPNDLLTKGAFGAGEIVPNLVGGVGIANKVGEIANATKNISRIPVVGSTLARAGEGAIGGTLTGEDKEGSRASAAITGGVVNPIASAAKYVKSLLPEGLAKNILSAKNAAQNKYSELYDGLFQKAKNAGLHQTPLRVPKINIDLIKNNSEKKYYQSLDEFNKNPTLENAHWAQSDMGKLAANFDKLSRNNALTSTQIKTMEEAIEAQKKLRGSMFTGMTKSGSPDLANEYGQITRGYKTDVIPYTRTKAITDLQNQDINPQVFAKRIYNSNKFRTQMAEKHPEIAHSEILNKLLGIVPSAKDIAKFGAGGLATAAGLGGYDYYKSGEF